MESSRRDFLHRTTAAATAIAITSTVAAQPSPAPAARTSSPTPDEALNMLMEGNARFVDGKAGNACRTPADFNRVAAGQAPFATIVGCADSRVGPETLFDQGVGDLFVVRVAGNVVDGAGNTAKAGKVNVVAAGLRPAHGQGDAGRLTGRSEGPPSFRRSAGITAVVGSTEL